MRTRGLLALLLLAVPSAGRAEGEASGGAPVDPRLRPGEEITALVGADVVTVSGPVIRRGTVLLRDGRILAVGVDLPVPEGARVISLEGKRLLPGFVALDAENIGLAAGGPRPGGLFRDSLDPFSRTCELALGAGLTAFHASVLRDRGFSTSQTAVMRPAPGEPSLMVLKEPASLWVNYARGTAIERMGFEESLRKGVRHLQDVETARREKRDPPKPPVPPDILAALRGEIPVRVPASWRDEIHDALRLGEEFRLRLVLEECLEGWIVPEAIARAGATAVVTPRRRTRVAGRAETHGGSIECAAILERSGARFCILPAGGVAQPGRGIVPGGLAGRDLLDDPVEGAFAIRGGASEAAVLRAMTLGAAEALGVADRIGSIEPGKDADLIVMDGEPFHYRSVVDMALVSGKVLYERSKSNLFRELQGR